jgi:pimeloyl-ACP methyl ester carboxylesterase
LFGFSNGGAFAIALALRHPTLYAAAVAFSVPPLPLLPPWGGGAVQPAFYLAVGDHGPERQIRKRMLQLAQRLRRQGLRTEFAYRRNARHTLGLWGPELVLAAKWLQDARSPHQGVDPGR